MPLFCRKKNMKIKVPIQSENKKVRNATKVQCDGQVFLSEIEFKCYLLLKASKLDFGHETEKLVIFPGFKDANILDWKWDKKKRTFLQKPMYKVQDITYTPDFVVNLPGRKVYIEVKGNPNDRFPMKYKMFLRYLSERMKEDGIKREYVIVKSLTQMKDVISKLNEDYCNNR